MQASQRLRSLIHEELERRGIKDPERVGAVLGLTAREADTRPSPHSPSQPIFDGSRALQTEARDDARAIKDIARMEIAGLKEEGRLAELHRARSEVARWRVRPDEEGGYLARGWAIRAAMVRANGRARGRTVRLLRLVRMPLRRVERTNPIAWVFASRP